MSITIPWWPCYSAGQCWPDYCEAGGHWAPLCWPQCNLKAIVVIDHAWTALPMHYVGPFCKLQGSNPHTLCSDRMPRSHKILMLVCLQNGAKQWCQ